jgi:hypothetical protein
MFTLRELRNPARNVVGREFGKCPLERRRQRSKGNIKIFIHAMGYGLDIS